MNPTASLLPRILRLTVALLPAVLAVTRASAHDWSVGDLQTTSAGQPLPDRRPAKYFSRDYGHLLLDDTRDTLTAPLRWDAQDAKLVAGLAALVAGSAVFDEQIREESQENRDTTLDNFTAQMQRFGAEYSFITLGCFEVYGRTAHNANAHATAMDGLTSSFIASGLITPILKYTIGRVRPDKASSVFEFKPFSGADSFPSGHTTQAFAVASVVAAHYPNWPVRIVSYGIAGMVGYSRIEQNAHYMSDVVAGAVIGTAVGLHVVKLHDQPKDKPSRISLAPFTIKHATGLMVQREF